MARMLPEAPTTTDPAAENRTMPLPGPGVLDQVLPLHVPEYAKVVMVPLVSETFPLKLKLELITSVLELSIVTFAIVAVDAAGNMTYAPFSKDNDEISVPLGIV